MSIDAKQTFLSQVEHKCADRLTVKDMAWLMNVLSDLMQGYSMGTMPGTTWEMVKDDMLESFVSSLRVQGRSEKTIARYTYIIGKFMKYAGVPTRAVNVYHVRSWIAAEKQRGVQDSTLDGNRQVLNAYFGWLFRESLIEKNPIVNVGVIKVPKKQRKIYTDIEIEKLNQCCKTLRDRAIVQFLRATGCRISEMTELNRDQLDLDALECTVHGKGDKDRIVFFDAVTGMIVRKYLESRKDDNPALFVGKRNERLQPGGVRAMLKKLGEVAGVDNVHPHKFRRTLATGLARHGMPIQEVAMLLGHEQLDTTMKYVNVDREDTKYTYRRFA